MVSYEDNNDNAVIHHILSRKSVFLRSAVGMKNQAQVVASNVDIVFICMSLNNNYSLNRLERYLSIAWDSGATPVIVLTKSDLCDNLEQIISEVEKVSMYSDIIVTSMFDNNINKFESYIKEGITVAFIGSSGVGKSTLINQIVNDNVIRTQEIGRDDKGKHTTTNREMFTSQLGGAIIDTPGMREIGIQNADLTKSFADIEELAKDCKFSDCSHTNEPGCKIQEAILNKEIDQRRVDSYIKQKNEMSYDGLNSKQIEKQKIERMFKDVGGMKNARKISKEKHKRK